MRICTSVLVGVAVLHCALGIAQGASLSLSGDFENNTWFQGPGTLLNTNTLLMPFVFNNPAGRGSIQGDVMASHNGSMFSLKITNLSIHAFDWSPVHKTDMRLTLTQAFDCLPGHYAATHSIDGVMDSTLGCLVSANTLIDSGFTSVFLPVVTYGSPGPGLYPFNVGPTGMDTHTTHHDILIKMQLDLSIFGDGTIIMPGSDASETIPAPGAALVLGLGAIVARRRRRN